MKKRTLFLCTAALLLFVQCGKDFDSYYERPEWLEPPIYQLLEKDGDFSLYLQAVDRTLQKQILSGAGLYTCFAPNDKAFKAWMDANGFKSVDAIPQDRLNDLVSYSLVYNLYKQENLGSALVQKLWTPGLAYKYKTMYYPMLSREEYLGDSVWVMDFNVQNGYVYSSKSEIVGNYKYLPVYTQAFFDAATPALLATDYEAFYPSSRWTGYNVAHAAMVPVSGTIYQRLAENGVVYEIDAVVEPIENTYDLLNRRYEEFSEFMSLLDFKRSDGVYYYKTYVGDNDELTKAFQLIYPDKGIDKVYLRGYGGLALSPEVEAYSGEKSGADGSQENATTLFLPSNEAMKQFKEQVLMKYYTSLEEVPEEAMRIFINSQVANHLVWPSAFAASQNSQGEYLNGEGKSGRTLDESGVKEKIMTSNGMVYVTDSIVRSRYFETVYTEIFLNPIYEWLDKAYTNYFANSLRADLMKSTLTGYASERNTVLLFDDDLLREDGFAYDDVNNAFTHRTADGPIRFQRLIRNHVFFGYRDDSTTHMEGADLTAEVFAAKGPNSANGWQYRVNNYGELVRFKENMIQGIGDAEEGTYATITPVAEYPNGHVFKLDRLLKYSPTETASGKEAYSDRTLWYYLDQARTDNPNVKLFVDYVQAFMMGANNTILGVKESNYYTVLMPNNSAINKAIDAGLLPSKPLYDEQDQGGANKALRFLQAHFLQGRIIADDNLPIIYPVDPFSDNYASYVLPTLLTITDDALGLANAKTMVKAYKRRASASTVSLYFCAQNITSGGMIRVAGFPKEDSTNDKAYRNHLKANSGKLTNDRDMCKTNRMACKSVLHEVNNYLYFENQY